MSEYRENRWPDGSVERLMDGRRHSDVGPAVELADGSVMYFRHGRLHNTSGPAVVRRCGCFPFAAVEYWIDGVRVSGSDSRITHGSPRLRVTG